MNRLTKYSSIFAAPADSARPRSSCPSVALFIAVADSALNLLSTVTRGDLLSMVELLPPAPAALVLLGRALATLSARSAAALLLIAVAGPPGGLGDEGRAVVELEEDGGLTGEVGRGEDWREDAC